MKLRDITLVALMAAFLCVISPFSVPIGPVPITLGTLGVYLIGALLDFKRALFAVLIYLVLGMIGLPVFSNFAGGLEKLAGPTGGFLIGYLFGIFVESLLITLIKKKWFYPLSMIAATVFIYGFGLIWFMISMGDKYTFVDALMACVVPFLIGDAIKIVTATLVSYALRPFLDRHLLMEKRNIRKSRPALIRGEGNPDQDEEKKDQKTEIK